MNILFLHVDISAHKYGIGNYVAILAGELAKRKGIKIYHIELCYTGRRELSYEQKGNTSYLRIPEPVLCPNLLFSSDANKLKYADLVVNSCRKYFKLEGDTVIHNNYSMSWYIALELSQDGNYPIVSTIHTLPWKFLFDTKDKSFNKINRIGSDYMRYSKRSLDSLKNSYEEELMNRADKVIFVTAYAKNILTRIYNLPQGKGTLIYNGAPHNNIKILSPAEKAALKKEMGFAEEEQLIVFCGRLTESKGIFHLIDAFKQVLKELPGCRLIIMGDGEFSPTLKACQGIWSNVIFTGYLEKSSLYAFFQIADIGVVPSLHEQCSLVSIEMMLHQLPMVVTAIDGLAEIFEDNETALMVAVDQGNTANKITIDSHSLAMQLLTLLTTTALQDKIGRNARQLGLDGFTARKMTDDTINVYKKALSGRLVKASSEQTRN